MTRVGAESVFAFIAPSGRPMPVEVELGYRADDPHAVTMTFRMGRQETVWLVSRDLLADGLITTSGAGDVRLKPYNSTTAAMSCSPYPAAMALSRSPSAADAVVRSWD